MSDMTSPPENQQPPPTQAEIDLAGYPNANELAKAYRASGEEAKKWRAYASQLEQQTQQQPVAPANPGRTAADRLREFGFPVEDLQEYINEQAGQQVRDQLNPISQTFTARGELVAKYGEAYQKFEPEVIRYVQSDPEMNQTYQQLSRVNPKAALDYAYLSYGSEQSRSGNHPAIQAAQAQASLPAARTGGETRGEPDPWELRQELRQKFLETRDSRYLDALKRVAFKQAIPDEFLNR